MDEAYQETIYGDRIRREKEPYIHIPMGFTNFLGIHIENDELKRVGVIDREEDIIPQIYRFKQNAISDLEIAEPLSLVDPSKMCKKGKKR